MHTIIPRLLRPEEYRSRIFVLAHATPPSFPAAPACDENRQQTGVLASSRRPTANWTLIRRFVEKGRPPTLQCVPSEKHSVAEMKPRRLFVEQACFEASSHHGVTWKSCVYYRALNPVLDRLRWSAGCRRERAGPREHDR